MVTLPIINKIKMKSLNELETPERYDLTKTDFAKMPGKDDYEMGTFRKVAATVAGYALLAAAMYTFGTTLVLPSSGSPVLLLEKAFSRPVSSVETEDVLQDREGNEVVCPEGVSLETCIKKNIGEGQ